MIRALFQFTLCTAVIFVSVSYGRNPSIQGKEIDIRELEALTARETFLQMRRPWYQRSYDSKRENERLPEMKCAPYPEVVPVEPDVTHLRNSPQFVRVNRCKGACDLARILHKCEATKMRMRSVKVLTEDGGEFVKQVQDHVACTCSCRLACNDDQILDEVQCKCICKEKCTNGGMQNPDTCQCTGRRNKIIQY